MSTRALIAVMLLVASSTAAAEIGRMFFTPAQRAALDAARKQNIRVDIGNDETEKPPTAPAATAPVPQTVRLNGMIQRSDGKNTVWLNNKPITDQHAGGMNFSTNRNDTRVKLQLPEGGRSMDLKVGQTAEIVSGTIEENYNRRAPLKIEDKTPPPAAGNDAAGVQKRTAEATPDSIESSSRLQRKPRAAPRDAQDETPAGGPDAR